MHQDEHRSRKTRTPVQARQGRITGVIWILLFSLLLAVLAGLLLLTL